MLKKNKKINKVVSEIDELANHYFQCIYYLSTTTEGENQDIEYNVIPQNIKVDENDNLIIYSNIGIYNFHLIKPNDMLYNHIESISKINSIFKFNINDLNQKIQNLCYYGW